jgi:carbonic anhydrase
LQVEGDAVEWGYAGPGRPDNWARISEEFITCEEGKQQSPVDIPAEGTRQETLDMGEMAISYIHDSKAIRNDGRAVHVDYAEGNTLKVNGNPYRLESIHCHSPSEHLIDGSDFAAELHMVHRNDDDTLLVLSHLYEHGSPNPVIQTILETAPVADSAEVNNPVINAADFVPDTFDHYRYIGSLTRPPCSEPVRWFVLSRPGTVSTEQVAALLELSGGPNNRPVQPLGDRVITKVSYMASTPEGTNP